MSQTEATKTESYLPRVLRLWANDPGVTRNSDALTINLRAAADEIDRLNKIIDGYAEATGRSAPT